MDSENKLDELLAHYKLPLAIGLVGLVLFVGGVITSGIIPKTFIKSSKTPAATQPRQTSSGEASSIVKIDVSGAVVNPGVYSLSTNDRIEEAIKAAGGVTEDADPIYLAKSVNLAQKVVDGTKIYIPRAQDAAKTGGAAPAVAGASVENNLVNINSASISDLDKLPGVGEVTAQKIIEKRPYGGIEELLTKKAVSRSVYEKIKGLVSVY